MPTKRPHDPELMELNLLPLAAAPASSRLGAPLPAALTSPEDAPEPPPPGGALAMLATSGLLMVALVGWAALARLDINTRASGQLVPTGFSQPIQHAEGGMVHKVFVTERQSVKAGQALFQLAADGLAQDVSETAIRLAYLQEEEARLRQLLSAPVQTFSEADISPSAGAQSSPTAVSQSSSTLPVSLTAPFPVLPAVLSPEASARLALQQRHAAVQRNLALGQSQLQRLQKLRKRGVVAETNVVEEEQRVNELTAQLADLSDQLYRQLTTVARDASATAQQLTKLQQRSQRLAVTAPMDGVVANLAITRPGLVLGPGQTALTLIPANTPLVAAVLLDAADVPHVRSGQTVQIRLGGYDYARYGTLPGKLALVAADSTGPDGTPRYRATITLSAQTIANGQPLVAGLPLEADILTGRRSVLAYLLKPLTVARHQALTER